MSTTLRKFTPTTLGKVTVEGKARNKGEFGIPDVMAVNKGEGLVPMRDHVRADDISRYKVVPPRAFAYNPMRINIGSIAYNTLGRSCVVSPDYVVFECDPEKLDPDFLNHYRESHRWEDFMESAGSGSVRIRIYYSDLALMKLRLPHIDDQKKIAKALNLIDAHLAQLTALLDAKREFKRGLMNDLLTGRRRFPGFEGKWKKVKLGDVALINPRTSIDLAESAEISFLPMSHVSERGVRISIDTKRLQDIGAGYTTFQDHDILVAKITPCFENGKGWLAQGLMNGIGKGSTEFHVLRAGENILPEFINLHTQSYLFRERGESTMTGSAGQKRVPTEFLNAYPIKLPNITEQRKIIDILNYCDFELHAIELFIEYTQKYKQSLMQWLLSKETH